MEVVNTGNFKSLVTRGKLPEAYLLDVWEGLIKDNEQHTGTRKHQHYFRLYSSYVKLLGDYYLNRTLLLKLTFSCEWETIQEVRDRGFKIDTGSKTAFALSLAASLTKCENILTKIQSKQKEIAKLTEGRVDKTETFEDLIAFLEMNGFKPDYSITLKQFNANCNLIKKKHAAMESNQRQGLNKSANRGANRKAGNAA